jgi:ribosomal protein S18 acetylase RimI-like enzyme
MSLTEVVRPAQAADVAALARLHASRVGEGFLPTLGEPFLGRLYRRIIRSPRGCAFVVDDAGRVAAFAAGATDLSALYREFVVRDGVAAGFRAIVPIARSARRVLETLRYPATTAGLPPAEVLAVATAAGATGRGFGKRVVRAVTAELGRRGAPAVKVTVGAGNDAALAMYASCGFETVTRVRVHREAASEVLVWKAP